MSEIKVTRLDESGDTAQSFANAGAASAYVNRQVQQSNCWVMLDGSFHGARSVSQSDLNGVGEVVLTPQIVGG